MKIDPGSETWRAVLKHAEAEIEQAQRRLEQPGAPHPDYERGVIAAMRTLMKADSAPIEIGQTVPY